jgi:hypothetical protein
MFAAFLILLTVFPKFCTRAPQPRPTDLDQEPVPPSEAPMAGGVLKKRTPAVTPKNEKPRFTQEDRQQIEQEARILEWHICQEKEPSADLCRVTSVRVSSLSDGRAVAKIYFEYHDSQWESPTPRAFSVSRLFERFSDGWVLSE